MSSDDSSARVRDLLSEGILWVEDGNHGENRPLSAEFAKEGTPFIRPDDLAHGAVNFSSCDRINSKALNRIRKGKGRPGDIAFTHRATVGRIARVGSNAPDFVANPGVTLWRVLDKTTLDPDYLYYFMQTSFYMNQVWAEAGNTDTFPYISLTQQRGLEIRFPIVDVQRSIGATLGTLDDRIRLLRENNATLEAIALALFKSWFVDFDPVRAKMADLAPEGMDEAMASLFPDDFEDSVLGEIPIGWPICSFRDSIHMIGGGTPNRSNSTYWGGDIPWFSVADAPAATDVFVVDTEKHITSEGLNGSPTKLLPAGTTIISARGTVGRLALTGCEMAMNQSCYGLRGKAGDDYFTYFSTARLVEQLKQRAHGSVFDTITKETFGRVFLSYPSSEVIAAYDELVMPLMERMNANLMQSRSLTNLRDTLLPRLISGQLRLPQAMADADSALA